MVLDNFRRKLRQESQRWRDEGLINSSQHQQLSDRYEFNKIEQASRDNFVILVIIIGSILLSLGVITFIAANSQAWSREVKLIVVMSLLIGTSITGFNYFRQGLASGSGNKSQASKKTLGELLLFVSALILGANMAVMAQIFNVSSSSSALFLAWGLGVIAMAYSLRLTSLGILGIALMQVGYWTGVEEWFNSPAIDSWAQLIVRHMPLISWLLYIPLAYLCISRWIFALAAIAFATALQLNLNPLQRLSYADIAPWVASFAFALPPALWWSYDDLLFPKVNYRLFQPLARTLALIFFGVIFSVLSFRWQWDTSYFSTLNRDGNSMLRSLPFLDIGILSGLVVLQWLYLLRHRNTISRRLDINIIAIASFIFITALVPYWHQAISPIGPLAIFIFNSMLSIFACGLMREGMLTGDRRAFWGGMLLLTSQIISRVLEYDTDLLFRALVFAFCGWGVMSAGLWFERRLSNPSNSGNKK
jgi:uncharacterized membrane protein